MVIGVLAFQGDFAEHIDVLIGMHVPTIEVRSLDDLAKVDALIIPGGESTVIAKFLEETGVGKEIRRRALSPGPSPGTGEGRKLLVYGTCAGAIVLAKKVTGKNPPKTLGLIDASLHRNAYGTQVHSFEATLKISGVRRPVSVAFIRAPKITAVGKGVEILAKFRGEPVLLRHGRVMIGTFHPEVRTASEVHQIFLAMAE